MPQSWRGTSWLTAVDKSRLRYSTARADNDEALSVLPPGACASHGSELAERCPRRRLDRSPGAAPGGHDQQPRHSTGGYGQAIGSGSRVPQGTGDPTEARRRQPRRHRFPQQPGGQPQQPRPRPARIRASHRRRRPSTSKALAINQKLADDNPAVTQSRVYLASRHVASGDLLAKTGKSSEAEAEYRKALAIQQKLADDDPAVTYFRDNLALSYNILGRLLASDGQAIGRRGRVPQGTGDPTEAGRRQPRRHPFSEESGGPPVQPGFAARARPETPVKQSAT